MDLSIFDPELRFAARLLPRGLGRRWLLPLLRMIPVPSGRLPDGISLLQHRLSNDASVIGRMFTPSRPVEQPSPAILWIHGGGYITGSAKQDDNLCARISKHLGLAVMSVDYRLAPEYRFPIPLDDCLLAFDYLVENADVFSQAIIQFWEAVPERLYVNYGEELPLPTWFEKAYLKDAAN